MTTKKCRDFQHILEDIDKEQWIDIIQNSNDLIQWVDQNCRFIYVNRTWMNKLGYSKDEIAELNLWDIIHPDDLDECKRTLQELISGTGLNIFQARFISKNGKTRYIEGSVKCKIVDGVPTWTRGIFRDITEKHQTECKLAETHQHMKRAQELAHVGSWRMDLSSNILTCSEETSRILGLDPEIGNIGYDNLADIVHHEDKEAFSNWFHDWLDMGGFETGDFRFQVNDNSIHYIQFSGEMSFDENDNPISLTGAIMDLTELKEAQKELRESEELLSSFMHSATDGIILLDKDLKLVKANQNGFEQLNVPPETAIGKKITEIASLRENDERYRAYVRTIETGEPYKVPELIWNWTPGMKQFSLKAFRVGEGLGLIISDITRIKEIEHETILQKAYMEDLFEGAPEGIAVLDQKDVVQKVNKEFTRMFGYTSEEAEGANDLDLIIPRGKKRESKELTLNVKNGNTVYCETKRRSKNGDLIDVSVLGTPINLSGNIVATYAIYRDITDIIKQKKELEKAKEIAEEAARSKSEFLANMSHEIRTPMNAILGFADLLSDQELSDKQSSYLESIRSSGKTLLTLINDILDLSKIDAGKIELNYHSANPHAIFNEMKQIFRKKVHDKGIGFDVEVSELVPRSLIFDEVRLRQILLNLAGNAVKFTDEGGIKLSVERTNILEDGSQIDLRFSIEDTGIGIPEDQLKNIFGTFEQMKGQDSGKYGGTGLGLAISKRLVEMMNGKIWVKSEVDKGSEFIVEFFNVAVASTYESESGPKQNINYTFKGSTVLIIDDIKQNRILVKGFLEERGLKFLEAENGKVAIEMLREGGIDLALMDMKMPVMTGFEATKRIKMDDELKNIPVIALTASAMEGDKEKILRLGCDGYLRKPVDRSSLLKELARFLPHNEVKIEEEIDEKMLEKESIHDDPEVIRNVMPTLMGEMKAQIGSALETGSIDDAMDLAEHIMKFSEKHGVNSLGRWGAELHDLVDGFDIESMIRHMNGFEMFISKLKAHAALEGGD
ncbi:MAG: PAS domain S-box protein [Candidatus Thermoplasmatota archaeon]|nr:PAS domain S-box protein [Candidatus Thermoplasmatota archaeon]